MIKIGLIGEDPNDTKSIKFLLEKKFFRDVVFIPLLKNLRGNQLDSLKTLTLIKTEFNFIQPDIIIFIRDADAVITEASKIEIRKAWFRSLSKVVTSKNILLLNIYELEALILSDILTFNHLYNTNISYDRNVVYHEKPKEFLKLKTHYKRYEERDAPLVFQHLNFSQVYQNCQYFREFVDELEKIIKSI